MRQHLKFFYQDEERFKKDIQPKIDYIEDVLLKLSVDKKSFSGKIRDIFGKQAEELREENQELKEELKARGEKIGELVEENKELQELSQDD